MSKQIEAAGGLMLNYLNSRGEDVFTHAVDQRQALIDAARAFERTWGVELVLESKTQGPAVTGPDQQED